MTKLECLKMAEDVIQEQLDGTLEYLQILDEQICVMEAKASKANRSCRILCNTWLETTIPGKEGIMEMVRLLQLERSSVKGKILDFEER